MAQDRRNYPISLKHRSVERWTQRRLGRIDHERRVASLAHALFHLTAHRHELQTSDLRLLGLSAVVHDVGRQIDDARHPQIGARMILNDTWLPVNDSERRALAYLTRYHRGAVPEIGYDDILTGSDERKRLRLVLALLRAADALDGRQLHPPRIVFSLQGRKISVGVYLAENTPKARRFFKRRKKFRLLEELLNLRVEPDVRQASVVHAVA